MRRSSGAFVIGLMVLALASPAMAARGRRASEAGPFVALRDAEGRPVLAWGADGLVRHTRELGYRVLVLTAAAVQHRSLTLPGVRIVRGCGYRDRATPRAVQRARSQVRRCAARLADEVRRGVPVLVTCAQGENRSALMAARIRHLVTGEAGSDIVAAMRRPAADHRSFINRAFRRIARGWPARMLNPPGRAPAPAGD